MIAAVLVTLIAILGALSGLFLTGGGVWLITLGGSWFYAIAGLLLLAAALFLFRRNTLAVWIALATLLLAGIWAAFDAGFAFWPYFSRVLTFVVMALVVVLCAPVLSGPGKNLLRGGVVAGLAGVLVVITVGFIAGMFRVHPLISADPGAAAARSVAVANEAGTDWPQYGRTVSGTRFAPFDQITPENVNQLEVAWVYRTGDIAWQGSEFQGTPIKVGNSLYTCTPHSHVAAINATTGTELWTYDPQAETETWQRCRGISYAETPQSSICPTRIILATIDARLIALNAETGVPCADFATNGEINLLIGLGPTAPGSYYPTSASLIAGDVIVVGGRINDNHTVGEPSGVVRAYDLVSGQYRWAWDPADHTRGQTPLAPGEIYPPESPNFWGTASYDPALNLIFVPTGNQTPDFWGGNRHPTSDEYNASIVAIDAATGIDRWHFRTVNHDLLDYDVAAQPILYDIPQADGSTVPAVIAMTKRGQIFVLDRRDGTPIIPVEERQVSTEGALEGQNPSSVQPYSAVSIGTDPLKESDMWGMSIFDQLYCRIHFKSLRYYGEFTQLNFEPAIIYPGYYGGMNWGGGAVDEATGTLLVNDIRMAQYGWFLEREQAEAQGFKPSSEGEYSLQLGTPYGVARSMFFSPLGVPCFKPPFGTISAVDLASGTIKWQTPMGSIEDSRVFGIRAGVNVPLGMPTMGGPMVTETGLTFFIGTMDYYVRALDSNTGEELWRDRLPVGGQATPMTYVSDENGKQYLVVTAGGVTRSGTNEERGDYVIAYTLP